MITLTVHAVYMCVSVYVSLLCTSCYRVQAHIREGNRASKEKEKKDDDLGGNIWEFVDEGLTGTLAGDPAGISPHIVILRGVKVVCA